MDVASCYAVQAANGGAWTIRVASLDSNRVDDVMEAHSNAIYASGSLIFIGDGTCSPSGSMNGRSVRWVTRPSR